jgi:hypothetical protein
MKLNISKELETFLRKKRAYSKFKRNTFNSGVKYEGEHTSLLCSFKWCDSPEGSTFWIRLYSEFREMMQDSEV